ncbi:hypothetical protein [Streptococcus hyointestinalis]|nr:hypothetical protein [Streptococcus hyointestinalis]MCI6871184.1 hypothetical protein [Streptococcus hyointestinalis]MDD6385219.1 hypothetical protein [Streptococcus hyointestinalis]
MKIILKEVTYTLYFGEEPVEVTSLLRFDKKTDKEVADKALYRAMIDKAHELYRKRHDLLTAQEILDFRNHNNMTRKQLAERTAIDELWLELLEAGELPSKEENRILKAFMHQSNETSEARS